MCHLNHPLIINLHYSFQDYDNLYFVLDLLTGGDLRYQLGRHPRRYYTEEQTKFFIACIVESLIYIHSKNIIHRDIKPENLIFDDKGYLHITDFGIAKYSYNNNINETSGTPGYMAPEVMRGLNHTGSVDYFAVGIITYELMMGKRPYTGKNRKEIKDQMMQKQIFLDYDNIPLGWSQEAADFINKLLIRKDTNRLGYYNYYEIKSHPWLNDINFNNLLSGKIRAPFIPRKNNDNYDKKYCQEVEEIGIETNVRYESYKNNEKYSNIFEGFTYYNVDESQLLNSNEIYRKPSVKYIKSNSNININDNYIINKSKTINLDYDYKKRISQNISYNRLPSANNTSMRTIHYSNGNEITTDRIVKSNLRQDINTVLIKKTKYSFKNPDDIYIMASPNRRGRITINNDETNIDNTFRKYANHSFVETNYSKGKTIRRSYSSSNLYNNNYVNVFNLLVNNINNINNNNILLNNINNIKNQQNYPKIPKKNNPINYNTTNKSKIPIDKKNRINDKNNNNYNVSNYNSRTLNEKTKNSSFSYADNDKTLYSGIKNNDYDNISFRCSSNCSYKNNNNVNIFNIESIESERKNYIIPDKYKNLKRNHSYSYICYFRNDIPRNSIKKILPIKMDNKNISFKNDNNKINSYSNQEKKEYINKIKNIEYISKKDSSNSFIYIDKYNTNKEIKPTINDICKLDKSKNQSSCTNDDATNINYNTIVYKNYDKRAPPPISMENNYNNIISKNEIKNENSKRKNNHIINTPRNKKILEKNTTYKKIPIPIPLNEKIKRKSLSIEDEFTIKINTKSINKNYEPINYSNFNPYYTIDNKENIKNNLENKFSETMNWNNQIPSNYFNNKVEIKLFGKINKISNIIPKKIIEKNFQRYQYLKNFDKYQKIKNNNKNKNSNYDKKVFKYFKNNK